MKKERSEEYEILKERQSQRRSFLTGRRRKDETREPATKDDVRTSLLLNRYQYDIVREIALREGMTIKDLISAMFQLGIDRYEEKHGKVEVRKWANTIVKDYTIQGWVMDEERLKRGGSILTKEYFEKQLEKIREIRMSERRFYQKITDIYAMAMMPTVSLPTTVMIVLFIILFIYVKMYYVGPTNIVINPQDADIAFYNI